MKYFVYRLLVIMYWLSSVEFTLDALILEYKLRWVGFFGQFASASSASHSFHRRRAAAPLFYNINRFSTCLTSSCMRIVLNYILFYLYIAIWIHTSYRSVWLVAYINMSFILRAIVLIYIFLFIWVNRMQKMRRISAILFVLDCILGWLSNELNIFRIFA